MDPNTAVLLAAIITVLGALVAALIALYSARWVQQRTMQAQRELHQAQQELQNAEIRTGEALSLRSSLEAQGRDMDKLRLDLATCQASHLTEQSARLQLEARVHSLEGDNNFLRRQFEHWTRRGEGS